MLTHATKQQLIEVIGRGLDRRYERAAVPIPITHPEYDHYNVRPTLRFRSMDVEPPEPPYTLATLAVPQPDIPDPQGVSDEGGGRDLGKEDLSDAENVDADLRVTKGRPVRDEVSIMTTAEGSVDIPGAPEGQDNLSADQRAEAVCRAIRKFLLERFNTAPLDEFDSDGNLVDAVVEPIYGGDFHPEVQVRPIAGRGVRKTPNGMSETDAQYNSGVNVHHFDTSVHHEFTPASGGFSTGFDSP